MYARVVVDVSRDRQFDYSVPDELVQHVHIGSRVEVPFRSRTVTGYIVSFPEQPACKSVKPLTRLVGQRPLVGESMLELARWMADYYVAGYEQAIRTVLPGAVRRHGTRFKKRLVVRLRGVDETAEIKEGEADPELTEKQTRVMDHLRVHGNSVLQRLIGTLEITAAPVRALEKKGLVVVESEKVGRDPLANRSILPTQHLPLMPEQAEALRLIREAIDGAPPESGAERAKPAHTVLLYGVTGSGKTEVYMQAIDDILHEGKGAIVLVPEISLTPQTVERFRARFGGQIAVLHSHLSDGERHDEWHRIQEGEARIVVGARSAVFAPVKDLGLIVVDEEHEPSYKQEDSPRYNARDVAVMRGHREGCAVVLGSATPSLESWFNAKSGKYTLATLPHRADNRTMPGMRIVDMRVEAERTGHVSVFSGDLLEAIRLRLDRAEQTILFLNRRGFATSLICPRCGYVANCDNCSVSYTYHRERDRLMCHICGGSRKLPTQCPECKDPAFRQAGIGTQRVESVLRKCFPHAVVQRMDSDTTTRKEAYEQILGDFRVGKTHVLVGTQMIAKGLHFPNVTLVGVIYADLSLHMADFRAGERTFQLLAQVAGRAGRGEVAGEVIVQTYTPFHPAIQAARRLDYEGFCDEEFAFRKELAYPPYTHLVCVTLRSKSEEKVSYCASLLARRLKRALAQRVTCSDPCPAPLARAKGQYRYQVMLRCASVRAMTEPLRQVVEEAKFPKEVTYSIDVDALSLL